MITDSFIGDYRKYMFNFFLTSRSSVIDLASVMAKKKKRAATEDIARIALEDLVKYFDLPIAEASRNLKVGLTVLKRKCREFGIPRWPHRKIKSLDSLIRNLQVLCFTLLCYIEFH